MPNGIRNPRSHERMEAREYTGVNKTTTLNRASYKPPAALRTNKNSIYTKDRHINENVVYKQRTKTQRLCSLTIHI